MPPYLFFVELLPFQARGELAFYSDYIAFKPKDCFSPGLDKLAKAEMFPCNNHLIKELRINFSEIKKIRRGYRLAILVPNMLVIKDREGRKFRFQVWGRGKLVKFVKKEIEEGSKSAGKD
jgi:hypothetical protein